jgi:hypothetical protein
MTFKAPESWKAQNRARRLGSALVSELARMEAAGLLDRETPPEHRRERSALAIPGSAA